MLQFYNFLRLWPNVSERIQKPSMAIDDKVRDGKLQYDINKEAAKSSALLYVNIHKYEYLTGE